MPGYRLTLKLGEGGFGEVWAATSPTSESVALKFIDCNGKPGAAVAQEIRMMRSLKDLRHPYFIRLYGACASSPYIIIIMERADGSLKDLQAIYQQEVGRNIPPDHLLELMEQAAEALDHLAQLKLPGLSWCDGCVQHCDVKPSNLLVLGDTLKVADFGLCAAAKQGSGRQGFRGTAPYAAPELYEGRATSRTDQFGLAVTYCELCIGPRAFCADRIWDGASYPGSPVDLAKLRDREYQVLARALSDRWTDRWPSCRAFIAALKQATNNSRRIHRSAVAAIPG
jgi:serine/threonine protein kinase